LNLQIVTIATVLICNPVFGQAPFGTPPGGNQQPQTEDSFISSDFSIPSEPGGGGATGGPCNVEIENTGNDIQVFNHLGETLTARVMVWDGCPGFYLGISSDAYSDPFLGGGAALEGSKVGTVEDPDVVLSQNIGSNVYVTIVYEVNNKIRYEEWRYDHDQELLSLVSYKTSLGHGSVLISDQNKESSNPNIDGNNNNQVVITYEEDEDIITHVSIGHPTSFDTQGQIKLTSCYGSNTFITPDVSISDASGFSSIASYAIIQEDVSGNELHLLQENFSTLNAYSSFPATHCLTRNPLELEDESANPRISSPNSNMIVHAYECAISAEYKFKEPYPSFTPVNGIKLYDNHHNSGYLSSFNRRLLNYNTSITNEVAYQNNKLPAITYASHGKVSVAWVYTNFVDNEGNDFEEDVISVNYDLNGNIRTPADYNYYMLVNYIREDNQFAPSVAGETVYGNPNNPVFYTFAGVYGGLYRPVYKSSNTSLQPQIRKKNILTDGVNVTEEVLIYPNPTTQKVNIDFKGIDENESIRLRIITIDGKVVYDKTALTSGFSQAIDVTNFEKGIYLLEYEYGNVIERKKVIIQ
jgi:hypothetical protein